MLKQERFYILPSGKVISREELTLQLEGTTEEQARNCLSMQAYSEEDIVAMLATRDSK